MLGHMADELLSSVLVSIPKDARGSLTNSDNYRAIALFSAIGKVIDMLVIERRSEQLMTSSSQFAFKSNHSTSRVYKCCKRSTIINYYNGRNTNAHACLLDATNAFDCVRYDKLFNLCCC